MASQLQMMMMVMSGLGFIVIRLGIDLAEG
jgi:hypothetical protein